MALLRNSSLRRDGPFPPLTSCHADDLGGAAGVESVHECDAYVDFGGLAVDDGGVAAARVTGAVGGDCGDGFMM